MTLGAERYLKDERMKLIYLSFHAMSRGSSPPAIIIQMKVTIINSHL